MHALAMRELEGYFSSDDTVWKSHEVLVIPEQPFVVHCLPFQWPIVAMPIANRFPVGAIVLPSPIGIGRVNVPVITPVTAVHVPEPKRIGWTLILMSGAKTKRPFRSSMCLSMPFVS